MLADPRFHETLPLLDACWRSPPSSSASLLVVPTAYWVQLRLPRLRPVVEFITLLPLVIPAIVLVFGYLRIYNSSSWLPLTAQRAGDRPPADRSATSTLALPYMYRAVDTGLRGDRRRGR